MKLPKGFKLAAIHCGIKKRKLDLGLILCDRLSTAAGFFTSNANKSYSVILSKANIKNPIKAVLVNSGNANCFTHKKGLKDTELITRGLAKLLKVNKRNILIASTGIIGKKLPKEKIIKSLPLLLRSLGKNINNFSSSIITTDSFKKIAYSKFSVKGKTVNIIGFAKGAGMIYPNMATMLGFILTDAEVSKGAFRKLASSAIEESFNSISVDGCMSTNDCVFFLSSRKVPLKSKADLNLFSKNLKEVCLNLAKAIVKDGEGATKLVEIIIKGARTKKEAKLACFYIANSNLFKCALYGSNPNWGRIVAALGAGGIKVGQKNSIKLENIEKKNVRIAVNLKRGKFSWRVFTSDLTPQYVKINAEYS